MTKPKLDGQKRALERRKREALKWALIEGPEAARKRQIAEAEVLTLQKRIGLRSNDDHTG